MTPEDTPIPPSDIEPRKQEELIAALISERTIAGAARVAGVSKSTALRWMQDPDFQRDYREARRAVVEFAVADVQNHLSAAGAALLEIVRDKKQKGSVRVSAAREMFAVGVRGVEMLDLETRLSELETRLEKGT